MNSNAKTGGGGIRERRLAAGISQERLAQAARCSAAMVRLVEAGYSPAGSAVVPRIVAALDAAGSPSPAPMSGPVADAAQALAWSEDGTAVATVPQGDDATVIAGLREAADGLVAERRFRPELHAALARGDEIDRPEAAFVIVAWTGGDPPECLEGVPHVLLTGDGAGSGS